MGGLVVKPLPQVRFLLAWGAYKKGAVIRPASRRQLDWLLGSVWYGRRIAELVEEVPPAPPPVAARAPEVAEPPAPAAEPSESPASDPEPRPAWRGKSKKGYHP